MILFDSNPMDLIKRRKEAKRTVDPFTDIEIEKILTNCPKKQRFVYEVFLNTSIRLDELTHLRFADFNSERRLLHIRSRSEGGGAKGDKARDIHLPDLLLKKYENYMADYRQKIPATSNYVFVNSQGAPISNNAIWSRMKRLGQKLKIHIHPHKFRATFATDHHRNGTPILVINLLMGHETIETTKRYILVTEDEKREAQQKATWLGKISEDIKQLEKHDREFQDLVSEIDEYIKQGENLVQRLRSLSR
jgi:integrase/recombinase XerC